MVLITLSIALSVLAYSPPLLPFGNTQKHKSAAVWIFIPRSVFPIRTVLPLFHAALTGGNRSLGSITSQTVPHRPCTLYEAPTGEIFKNIYAIMTLFVSEGGKTLGERFSPAV